MVKVLIKASQPPELSVGISVPTEVTVDVHLRPIDVIVNNSVHNTQEDADRTEEERQDDAGTETGLGGVLKTATVPVSAFVLVLVRRLPQPVENQVLQLKPEKTVEDCHDLVDAHANETNRTDIITAYGQSIPLIGLFLLCRPLPLPGTWGCRLA